MPKDHEKFYSSGKRMILVVDDEEMNRIMLGEMLKSDYEVIYAEDGVKALKMIEDNRSELSLILLDLVMPELNGMELLRQIKDDERLQHIPVIILTAQQEAEVECLREGAIDFIPKPYPHPDVVRARVLRTIELSEDRDIIHFTERDPLTNLYNKEYFYRYAVQFDQHHKNMEMDAIVVDVNHFHMINERYGKAYGDDVLRRIGEKLLEMVGGSDGIVCRREADTFLVYCPHREDYKTIIEKASIGLAGDDSVNDRVRLRMGVYKNVDKELDIERRFDRAKIAADTVRNTFTKTIGFYDSTLHEAELYAEQLIEDFRRAIEERQFVVYYQPKFDVRPEIPVLASAEALVRWIHPELGMINPGVFIPLFENNGLIQELDNYVWRTAAEQIKDWKERFDITIPVSVNVSRIDMYDPHLIDTLEQILCTNGLTPREFLLEITESAYTQDSEQIIETVNKLRSLGFRIEMDDFGTGYSSLNMISALPIDALKLDMQFIRTAFDQQKDTRMLEVIIDIADYLSVPVIAEGVETKEQLDALIAMGCDLVQGYYFSRPLPPEEYEQFVIERKKIEDTYPLGADAKSPRTLDPFDASFGKIAHALSSGFERIYYIDIRNDHYVAFTSDGRYEDLQIERSGADFYDEIQSVILERVFADDRERLALFLQKESVLSKIMDAKPASITYRVEMGESIHYYNLKAVHANTHDEHHIVMGVMNIDLQITEEERLALQRGNHLTFARIAHALSQDYFSIYCVNARTDHFIEYSAHEGYESLGIEKEGDAFFETSRRNILRVVDPEDQELLSNALIKENMMAELEKNGIYTLTYRLLLDGKPTYVHMKATYMDDDTDKHIVIGVSNVDEEIKREQEHAKALRKARELANRDALTGVKSRHAYLESEKELNANLALGNTEAFAVVVCDVNGLKAINDTRGHKVGDQYIKDACRMICDVFKHSPVYRIGGDEFAVILRAGDYDIRQELMEQLSSKNLEHLETDHVIIAAGLADYIPLEDSSVAPVFERADQAMYVNKKALKDAGYQSV